MGAIEARRTASGVAGPDDVSDRSVDSVLRPDPAEVRGAGELVQRIDALLGAKRAGRLGGPDGEGVEIPASVMATCATAPY